MKHFNNMRKIRFLGGFTKNQYIAGELPKKGRREGGGVLDNLQKRRGDVFEGGGSYPNAHCFFFFFFFFYHTLTNFLHFSIISPSENS